MNAYHIFAFLVGVNITACAWFVRSAVVGIRRMQQVTECYRKGYIEGLDIGCKAMADYVTRTYGKRANGFAIFCDGCGCPVAAVLSPRDEYCTCHKCGHRNPAPLMGATANH